MSDCIIMKVVTVEPTDDHRSAVPLSSAKLLGVLQLISWILQDSVWLL